MNKLTFLSSQSSDEMYNADFEYDPTNYHLEQEQLLTDSVTIQEQIDSETMQILRQW
mgnify:FL=1|tara:strand:+ start:637 stop:807 length:171 start_codon:yes stop_codon:yes gene_type:complete